MRSELAPTDTDFQAEGHHHLQFWGPADPLNRSAICQFLAEGLSAGERVIVIASEESQRRLRDLLLEGDWGPDTKASGRFVCLDAKETLAAIMSAEKVDCKRFEALLFGPAGAKGPFRRYSELPGMLWRDGKRTAAIEIEQFWNRVLLRTSGRLWCSYPLDVFSDEFGIATVDPILCEHSHCRPAANNRLHDAMNRAIDDVLGPRAPKIRALMRPNYRPSWAVLPEVHGAMLWVRNNLPGEAHSIAERAREY